MESFSIKPTKNIFWEKDKKTVIFKKDKEYPLTPLLGEEGELSFCALSEDGIQCTIYKLKATDFAKGRFEMTLTISEKD